MPSTRVRINTSSADTCGGTSMLCTVRSSSWCGTPKTRRQRALRIEIHEQHATSALGQCGAKVDGRGRLADATLLIADGDDRRRTVPVERGRLGYLTQRPPRRAELAGVARFLALVVVIATLRRGNHQLIRITPGPLRWLWRCHPYEPSASALRGCGGSPSEAFAPVSASASGPVSTPRPTRIRTTQPQLSVEPAKTGGRRRVGSVYRARGCAKA